MNKDTKRKIIQCNEVEPQKNYETVRDAIESIKGISDAELFFTPSKYEISTQQSKEDFRNFMAGNLGTGRVWEKPLNDFMTFEGSENLTIDGQGAVFMLDGLLQPFYFKNCKNITLKNFSVDCTRPLFSEGIVRLVKCNMVEIEIFEDYPLAGGEPVVSFQSFDPQNGVLTGLCPFVEISNIEKLSDNIIRIYSDYSRFLQIGHIVVLRHMYSYAHCFQLVDCENVKFDDITIYAYPGMGVVAERSKNLYFNKYQVRPHGKRIMSANVDGTHFKSCYGEIVLKNCYYEGMGDDAINVHGLYLDVDEKLGADCVRVYATNDCAPSGTRYRDFPDVGDTMEFVKKETLCSYASAIVKECVYDEKKMESVIKFDRPLPKEFKMDDLIANASKVAKLLVKNCEMRNLRGRAVLIQTRDAVVENNLFDHCTGQGVHVDTAYSWRESIGTRDVVIRNNRFISCGFGSSTYCTTMGVTVETESECSDASAHKNITIENNLFVGEKKPAIYLDSVMNVLIKDNRIVCDVSTPIVTKNVKNSHMIGNFHIAQMR